MLRMIKPNGMWKDHPSNVKDDKAKWDVVPTKISMDEILSIDLVPQSNDGSNQIGGNK